MQLTSAAFDAASSNHFHFCTKMQFNIVQIPEQTASSIDEPLCPTMVG